MPPIHHIIRRILLDALPLIAFYTTNSFTDFYAATAVLMAASVVTLAISVRIGERVTGMFWYATFPILMMGGLTLIFTEAEALKAEPTIINLLTALYLLGSSRFGHQPMHYHFGHVIRGVTLRGWHAVTVNTGLYLLLLSGLNEGVRQLATTDEWVFFKAFAIMPLSLLFGLSQLWVLRRNYQRDDTVAGMRHDPNAEERST